MNLLVKLKKLLLIALITLLMFDNSKASYELTQRGSSSGYLSPIAPIRDLKKMVASYLSDEWVLFKTFNFENSTLKPNGKFILKEEKPEVCIDCWGEISRSNKLSSELFNFCNNININLPGASGLIYECIFSKNLLILFDRLQFTNVLSLRDLKNINFKSPDIFGKTFNAMFGWVAWFVPMHIRAFKKSVAISPNEKYIAIADMTGILKIWDINTKELIYVFYITELFSHLLEDNRDWGGINHIAISSNNSYLAFEAKNQIIKLDLKMILDAYNENNKTQRFKLEQVLESTACRDGCKKLLFSEDNDLIYLDNENTLAFYDYTRLQFYNTLVHRHNVLDFVCLPCGHIRTIAQKGPSTYCIRLLGTKLGQKEIDNIFDLPFKLECAKAFFSPDGQEFTISGHTPYNENGFEGMRFIQQLWVNKGKYLTGYYQQTYELKRQAERDIRRQVF